MAINELKDILHKIRVKLYLNHLAKANGSKAEGRYIARTNNEATLTIQDICTTSINRGGFTDKYEDYVEHVTQFMEEAVYQLLDGYAVNFGYFSIHPNVGGTFDSDKEAHDHKRHPITFRFRSLSKLRQLAEMINVEIEGIANTNGYILEFTDVTTRAVNDTFTMMNEFVITGYRLKIAGDDPSVGLFFRNTTTNTLTKAYSLAENTTSKLIGICPIVVGDTFKIVIKTQYSGSSVYLKEVRTIESDFSIRKP